MRKFVTIVSMLLLCGFGSAMAADDTEQIQSLILKSYVHGAFNELSPEAMRAGFHPDFAIFSAKDEAIKKYPIDAWAKRTQERKSAADFDPANNKWDHEFVSIDVTGGAAAVKIELSKDGKLVYTDYLSLLRFESGWRIVAKVYASHD
jgi:hypothetical protein